MPPLARKFRTGDVSVLSAQPAPEVAVERAVACQRVRLAEQAAKAEELARSQAAKPRFEASDEPGDYRQAEWAELVDGLGPASVDRLLYAAWWQMVARCHSPSHVNFKFYGGRVDADGNPDPVTVDRRWRGVNGLNNFAEHVRSLPHYGEGRTLERIDDDRGYEPGNVRWLTPAEAQTAYIDRLTAALRLAPDLRDGLQELGIQISRGTDK